MRQIFTVLIVAGLFATAGCASTEGATAGENSADSGAEVKAAGETQATARRCRSYRPTGSHKSVRSCSGARGGNSRVQSIDMDEWKTDTITLGVINTMDRN